MRLAVALFAVTCLFVPTSAEACRTSASHTGVVYARAPDAASIPAGHSILDVAFDMSTLRSGPRGLQTITANVRRVAHGPFRGARIDVAVGLTSCSHPFMFGTEGYIVVAQQALGEGASLCGARASRRRTQIDAPTASL